ncbi:MAG TPA: threonine/serine dehydratase [Caulobacteraceae bacterium]|nr:threonine/serine dehydratase [Caulobacteraceae bacterium]
MSLDLAIGAEDVREAARMLAGVAVRTPLLEFPALNQAAGRRVLVKAEGLQRTGSFKFRGAYNRMARIAPERMAAGVVAWSSGNHAQGVAAAAQRLGMPALIVMPSDAPAIKADNTRALGAEVVLYDRHAQSREAIGMALARERGATIVPPFDDPLIIAGQGTVGLEIVAQAQAAGAALGQVLVCCGGGGLVAGTATAIKAAAPSVEVYAVEPRAFDDTARSLASGRREQVDPGARSICDALMAPSPGVLTFPINRALLSGGLVVDDDQVCEAMRFAFQAMKLVVEPGGAVALAAALHGLAPAAEGDLAVVLSGANVDAAQFAEILGGGGGA